MTDQTPFPESQPSGFPTTPPLAPPTGPWAPPAGIVPPQDPGPEQASVVPPPGPSYGPPSATPPGYAPPPAAGSSGPPFPPVPPTPVGGTSPEPSPRRRGSVLLAGVVGAVVAALVASLMWVTLPREQAGRTVTEVRPSLELDSQALDIQTLLTKVRPSVVSIKTGTGGSGGQAPGSGVVLSEDGLVLTNAHVVEGAASGIEVEFSDGSTHAAELVGSFPTNDVALVKARGVTGLTAATLGASESLQVGDDVVAIGNALNLGADPTVTKGIVSALDRSITAPGVQLEHLIQTDAAINPGNSGGPLVNAAGEVVGINTAIIPDSQNLGFSLAIDQIKPLIQQIKDGKGEINAETPFLGVSTTDIGEQRTELLDRFGIDVDTGAFVVEVVEGSAAAEAGLEPGDVIVSIDGTEVKSKDDVGAAVRARQPGDQIEVTYLRDGEQQTGTAQLGRRAN